MPSEPLPDDVSRALARALGAYLRDAPRGELPGTLRRFRGYRPQALTRHRAQLVGALDDAGLRAKVLEWLDAPSSRLSQPDAELLRLASARPEGWEAELRGHARPPRDAAQEASGDAVQRAREEEQARARRAREQARAVRDELRRAVDAERARAARLESELADARRRQDETRAEVGSEREERTREREELERRLRRAQRELQRAVRERDELRAEVRSERKRVADLAARLDEAGRPHERPGPRSATRRPERPPGQSPERIRRPLRAPIGRLEEQPETLDAWLGHAGVHLLVDGYNVTQAPGGYGNLALPGQRRRLVDELERLVRRKRVHATVVFDGSDVPPGTARLSRSLVDVHYSRPPESGDDHLVHVLGELPPDPVVVVTDDRGLRDRVRPLGATVAGSAQLLDLLRR